MKISHLASLTLAIILLADCGVQTVLPPTPPRVFPSIPLIVLGKGPGDSGQVRGLLVAWNPGTGRIQLGSRPLFQARWPLSEIYDYPQTRYVGWFWDGHHLLVIRTGEPGIFSPGSHPGLGLRVSTIDPGQTGWPFYFDGHFFVTGADAEVYAARWASTAAGIYPLGSPPPRRPAPGGGFYWSPNVGGSRAFKAIPFPRRQGQMANEFWPMLIASQKGQPVLYGCADNPNPSTSAPPLYLAYTRLTNPHWQTRPLYCNPWFSGAVVLGNKLYLPAENGQVYTLDLTKGTLTPFYSLPTAADSQAGPYLGLWRNLLLAGYLPSPGKFVLLAFRGRRVVASLTLNSAAGKLVSSSGSVAIPGGLAQAVPTLPSQGTAQSILTP